MIEKHDFGRTGHQSSRVLFGSAALWKVTQQEADQTLDILLKYGINHIDTAASYGDAELHIGPWMKNYRKHFFLATKTEKRTYREAWEELQRSLNRLQVDSIDLWQMHLLVDPAEWAVAMSEEGAIRAFQEAREKGLVRFLGVTGHGHTAARMHLKSLERFRFDSVLLPLNYLVLKDSRYAAEFQQLTDYCNQENIAIQTIKSLAVRPWGDQQPNHTTWYQPAESPADITRAVSWVLAHPHVFLNSAGDIRLLPLVLEAADQFQSAPEDSEMEAMFQRLEMADIFDK